MDNIIDAHYFLLPSQGNIYSLSKLCMCNGNNKILAASLRRKIFSFEYMCSDGALIPAVREVVFTYIPSGAEIISIDSFNKSTSGDDFVIGITIIKASSESNTETYLNIYSEWEPNSEFNLESVAQNCLMLELDFIPYQLYHSYILVNENNENTKEVVWLLSGSDNKIHVFREDRVNHCYSQVEVDTYFPEFSDIPSVVMWMDIRYNEEHTQRLTAYGCECGYMKLSVVDPQNREVITSWSARFAGSVSSVRMFDRYSSVQCPSFLGKEEDKLAEDSQVNLLVTSTLQPSVVYMNVAQNGLNCSHSLPSSEEFDAVLCSCIADIDMDGEQEILLGTYGQEMLMYKYKSDSWVLSGKRTFANPIHSVLYVDVTGDGVKELVVLSLRGVHILQHDPDIINEKLLRGYQEISNHDESDRGSAVTS
ncbi:KICSTOR complex protein kaptin-like isoform X1 [Schistocerca americana]|uniref:KICSTOR complex protein kaptin-like isoform X1 n=1 Tax=Schistocerca americana TaxID=7009 RepID=UPI001F4FEE5E|nr:KICSTOR complex protein kaptin-like isoform X1 [Schistocerca americana]XP_047116617.1 KICSTOR complex protein kaptin-like isoform X1 [Schistocerca piceifrons]